MDTIIQLIHIDWKQISQIIKLIKFMRVCKLSSTVQNENMVDLQRTGRLDRGQQMQQKWIVRLQEKSDFSIWLSGFRQ